MYGERLRQLHFPLNQRAFKGGMQSEIVALRDPRTNHIRHRIWFRTLCATGQVLYAGIYTTCRLPSGRRGIKVSFPLPEGNATVIMVPQVDTSGALHLSSAGKTFGDPGFYFTLRDMEGKLWARYIQSFREQLVVRVTDEGQLRARHHMSLWRQRMISIDFMMFDQAAVSPRAIA